MKYLKLMRVKHYIKNVFILVPLFFSRNFMNPDAVIKALLAVLMFSFTASLVYIINDLVDIEKDRQHPKKKNRPLASGKMKKSEAVGLFIVLAMIILVCSYFYLNIQVIGVLLAYFLMNVAYSLKLKNVVLIDVLILSLGFIFRVYVGALAIHVEASEWLLLTTFGLSLFMGFGKRFGEKRKTDGNTREVLSYYKEETLRYFMLISMTLTIIFYSLYTILGNTILHNAIITIPVVVLGIFRYYMLLDSNIDDGDPTEVVFNDRILQLIVVVYGVLVLFLI